MRIRLLSFALGRLGLTILVAGTVWAGCMLPLQAEADPTPAALAGTYYLRGVREVGSVLRLDPSGRFQYSISYGAVDSSAAGTWRIEGDVLSLTSDTPPPPSLSVGERRQSILDSYAERGAPPVLLTVQVATPSLGLVWSRMEITAEFSNGRRRSGVTGSSGEMGFKVLDGAEWQGAVVRRVSAAYPPGKVEPVWTDVNSARDKTVVFHFQPGSLLPPAFTTWKLLLASRGDGAPVFKPMSEDGQVRADEYVRD